jgi:hypothetical protein
MNHHRKLVATDARRLLITSETLHWPEISNVLASVATMLGGGT